MSARWRRYALSKSEIVGAFSGLLDAAELLFEDEASLEQALYMWKDSSAQFAECLIGARNWALERRATASFDNKAPTSTGAFYSRLPFRGAA